MFVVFALIKARLMGGLMFDGVVVGGNECGLSRLKCHKYCIKWWL